MIKKNFSVQFKYFVLDYNINSFLDLEILILLYKNSFMEYSFYRIEEHVHAPKKLIQRAIDNLSEQKLVKASKGISPVSYFYNNPGRQTDAFIKTLSLSYKDNIGLITEIIKITGKF